MTDNRLHIVFTGGGTGGHLFPGLAVAEQLVGEVSRVRITFVGSGKRFERRHVAAAGFEYLALPCRPRPRRVRDLFTFLVQNLAGYLAARRFLAEENVAAVVGLGGYASVPMARAAANRGVPLVLLEQNATAGRATRWLARRATLVCTAMAQSRSNFRCRCPVRVTGTPIRKQRVQGSGFRVQDFEFDLYPQVLNPEPQTLHPFLLAPRPSSLAPLAARRLVVLGGSNGARSLNENVPRALYKIRAKLDGWQIVHQSGEPGFERARELYRKFGLEATVVAFIPDVPQVLAASNLAVCRCGGTTLAELAAAGVPAILLPYPHATDDHQRKNAEVFTTAGGSLLLDRRELSGRLDDHLAGAISDLLADPARRKRMSAAMRRFARPKAAENVAAMVLEVAARRSGDALPAAA